MSEKVDHIGIAVHDLKDALATYETALDMTLEGTEVVEEQKVRVAKLRAGDDCIELLEPTSEDSPIAKFLEKRGGGIHHICLEVADIEATMARLSDAGMRLIDRKPKIGAGGHRIAFVHPASTHGVLIELSENAQ